MCVRGVLGLACAYVAGVSGGVLGRACVHAAVRGGGVPGGVGEWCPSLPPPAGGRGVVVTF